MIKRLRVLIPVRLNPGRSSGRIFLSRINLCTDSYSVSVLPLCYRSSTQKTVVILPKCRWQVTHKHAYTLDPMKSEWAGYATVQA